ncbi:MAG: hypothetical protein ACC628_06370 [Pirellulaceae bacterium]
MKPWNCRMAAWVTLALVLLVTPVLAAPPWTSLLPFKRIEADPNKSYPLQEEHGPWLVLTATFSGQGSDRQAQDLVLELRSRFKLPAYIHRQSYDYTQPVEGLTLNKYGEPARMRYASADRFDGYAVLVGDFEYVDDPALEKVLEKIKYADPDCLNLKKRKGSTQRFVGLRQFYRRVNLDKSKRNKGPMGSAFVTRNPLLPASYFVPQGGVDRFVLSLNRGVQYSLLDNPSRFTVRVASFGGMSTINQKKIHEIQRNQSVSNKLEVAADRSHRLTMALRERGAEAYEFHDRHESIVTVGGFDSEGTLLQSGSVDINAGILRIMQIYGASRTPLPGQQNVGLRPRTLAGIAFDVQPMPIKVPRRSIAADYARGRLFSR